MGRLPLRAGIAVAAGALLASGLAACTQILGLDDDLVGIDAGADGSVHGSDGGAGSDAGGDAAADGGPIGGPDAGDASPADGSRGDDGGPDVPPDVWQIDTDFGSKGAETLSPGMGNAAQLGLELVDFAGNGSTMPAGVYAVGIALTAQGQDVVVAFNASQSAAESTTSAALSGASYRLLGAFSSDAGITAFAQSDALDVERVPLGGSALPTAAPNAMGYTLSRLVLQDATGHFIGPGSTGDLDSLKGVQVTVGATTTGVTVDRNNDDLLALATTDGGAWFGGSAIDMFPSSAVLFQQTGDAGVRTILLGGQTAVTDFARAGTSLFAIGYDDASFALWSTVRPETAAPVLITPDGGVVPTDDEQCTDVPEDCLVRSSVCASDSTIVVSGALGDPYLATFDGTGKAVRLLTPPGGGSPASWIDLGSVLPAIDEGASWYAGAVLCVDHYVYAAFAASGANGAWAVVRLQRAAGP